MESFIDCTTSHGGEIKNAIPYDKKVGHFPWIWNLVYQGEWLPWNFNPNVLAFYMHWWFFFEHRECSEMWFLNMYSGVVKSREDLKCCNIWKNCSSISRSFDKLWLGYKIYLLCTVSQWGGAIDGRLCILHLGQVLCMQVCMQSLASPGWKRPLPESLASWCQAVQTVLSYLVNGLTLT